MPEAHRLLPRSAWRQTRRPAGGGAGVQWSEAPEGVGALRPTLPEFMVFGGMMVSKADVDKLLNVRQSFANQRHAVTLVLRYLADRLLGYARGTRLTMGNALCARLLRSV